jgi:hypothetical protein
VDLSLYFLLEGQTEKILYRAWLSYCFPHFKEVKQPADLKPGTFLLLVGEGHPSYLRLISGALADCAQQGVDHLFICVDAEERSREDRREELRNQLDLERHALQRQGLEYRGQVHLIVADCCIETWLLGHRKLMPRYPSSNTLTEYKKFYDVAAQDPERMGCPSGSTLARARFHFEYLREVFDHHGNKVYSKINPGIAKRPDYLAALRDRCLAPEAHLSSFRVLWDTWTALGAHTDVESTPPATSP